MAKFEIYEGLTAQKRKKTYLVFKNNQLDIDQAKRFFRCSFLHLKIVDGYVLDDELYLDDPKKAGAKAVAVAYYV